MGGGLWFIALALAAGLVKNCIPARLAAHPGVMSETECQHLSVTQRGRTFSGPYRRGDSLLQALLGLGVLPRYSCMSGECGACMAKVAEGTVRMQDNWSLSEAEVAMGYVLLCQSYPTAEAVSLDLPD